MRKLYIFLAFLLSSAVHASDTLDKYTGFFRDKSGVYFEITPDHKLIGMFGIDVASGAVADSAEIGTLKEGSNNSVVIVPSNKLIEEAAKLGELLASSTAVMQLSRDEKGIITSKTLAKVFGEVIDEMRLEPSSKSKQELISDTKKIVAGIQGKWTLDYREFFAGEKNRMRELNSDIPETDDLHMRSDNGFDLEKIKNAKECTMCDVPCKIVKQYNLKKIEFCSDGTCLVNDTYKRKYAISLDGKTIAIQYCPELDSDEITNETSYNHDLVIEDSQNLKLVDTSSDGISSTSWSMKKQSEAQDAKPLK